MNTEIAHTELTRSSRAIHKLSGSLVGSRGVIHVSDGWAYATNGSCTMIQHPTPLIDGTYDSHWGRLAKTLDFNLNELRQFFFCRTMPEKQVVDMAEPSSGIMPMFGLSAGVAKVLPAVDPKCTRPILRTVRISIRKATGKIQYRGGNDVSHAVYHGEDRIDAFDAFCLPYDCASLLARMDKMITKDPEALTEWGVELTDSVVAIHHEATSISIVTRRVADEQYPSLRLLETTADEEAESLLPNRGWVCSDAKELAEILTSVKRHSGMLQIGPSKAFNNKMMMTAHDKRLSPLTLASNIDPFEHNGRHMVFPDTSLFFDAVKASTGFINISLYRFPDDKHIGRTMIMALMIDTVGLIHIMPAE